MEVRPREGWKQRAAHGVQPDPQGHAQILKTGTLRRNCQFIPNFGRFYLILFNFVQLKFRDAEIA